MLSTILKEHWKVSDTGPGAGDASGFSRSGPDTSAWLDAPIPGGVNAALTDEPARVAELKKNRFSAFLDVFAAEPLPLDHPFRTMDNVVIAPHIAGDNSAMFLRCGREAVLTLKDYFDGKGIRNRQYVFL